MFLSRWLQWGFLWIQDGTKSIVISWLDEWIPFRWWRAAYKRKTDFWWKCWCIRFLFYNVEWWSSYFWWFFLWYPATGNKLKLLTLLNFDFLQDICCWRIYSETTWWSAIWFRCWCMWNIYDQWSTNNTSLFWSVQWKRMSIFDSEK